MLAHITVRKTTTPGPDLIVDCPSCQAKETLASCAHELRKEYLWGLIPLTTTKRTVVTCLACKDKLLSDRSIAELGAMTTPELSAMLANYSIAQVSFLTKFCILFSILAFYVPMISLVLAVVGIFQTRKRRTRWRTAAYVGLILSLIVNIIFVITLIFMPKTNT